MTGRGLRGRRTARLILVAAFGLVGVVALLLIAAPATSHPMFVVDQAPIPWLVSAIAIAGLAIGLGWMVRIYRADPEGQPSAFRATRR
jgi:NADH:ubiquinone oxidoreductase subunit K